MTETGVSAILLGAGQGSRLGGGGKAFIKVAGQSYLQHVVQKLAPLVDEVIVTLSAEDMLHLDPVHMSLPCQFVAGGDTRQGSFAKAFEQCRKEKILLHEVARPLVPVSLLGQIIEESNKNSVVTAALPMEVRDSIALSSGPVVGAKVPRDQLIQLQTPQMFDRAVLEYSLQYAADNEIEEASLVFLCQQAGYAVSWVKGSSKNFKVTYEEDRLKVERILADAKEGAS
ncbi:NTP transferase domain-containing protein [Sneathiella sp. P13V-1]|uniref:IspD/TarI family cytidylyltransferase n=1 Tax=Sneathiella sp. P13V-1 TaxID=2697366 RepID=UPI00187B7A16|nr:2-C-methyl-D-erythritol 4-phosphate cytidylyltransferase [Sneathiella sp. P13V-1]MBE7636265.1 NTP transferase domain-containing protein [Sneathiella sp. P13V-1]